MCVCVGRVSETRERESRWYLSTAISLIRMFREGPEVSLSGSPTVSPITAALCASEPLPPMARACSVLPASRYFLALSHAPPVLDALMAICRRQRAQIRSRP
jgi:hypothetical protein